MKKHICLIFISLVTIFCMCTVALADINVRIDPETQALNAQITIKGAENKMASIEVFNPGKSTSDISAMSSGGVMTVFDYIKEGKFDSLGKLTISYILDGESGYHSIRVTPDGMESVMYSDAFLFVSPQYEAEFLSSYCASDATNEIRLNLVNSAGSVLGLDINELSGYTHSQKLSLIDFMGKDFKSVSELKTDFACGITAHHIKNYVSKEITSKYFDKYKNEIKSASPVFSLYELYIPDESKDSFYRLLNTSKLNNFTDYINEVSDKIILSSLKNLTNHQDVENVIKTSESHLGEDFSDYYSLSDKKQVNLDLIQESFDTAKLFGKRVHELVIKYKPQTNHSLQNGITSPSVPSGPSVNVSVPMASQTNAAPIENQNIIFNDIKDFPWAQKAITSLYNMGVLNGVSKDSFEPQREINREEFTKLIVQAFFSPDKNAVINFEDVSPSDWSYTYIATAHSLGIINGVSTDMFGVGQPISRQDMALILYRAINAAKIDLPQVQSISFTDASDVSPYAMDGVAAISGYGIINGFEDGSFAPRLSATRAQAAKIIYETLLKGGKLSD